MNLIGKKKIVSVIFLGFLSACGILGTQEAPPKDVSVSVTDCTTDLNSFFLPKVSFKRKIDECGNEHVQCLVTTLDNQIVEYTGIGTGRSCVAPNQASAENITFELDETGDSVVVTFDEGETRSVSCRQGYQDMEIDDGDENCGNAVYRGGFFQGSLDHCSVELGKSENGQDIGYLLSMTHTNSAESHWLESYCSGSGYSYISNFTVIPYLDPGLQICYLRSSKFGGAEMVVKGFLGSPISCDALPQELIDGFGGEEVTQALLDDLPL